MGWLDSLLNNLKPKPKLIKSGLEINGAVVPLKIYVEKRQNCRASISTNGITIRVPIGMPTNQIHQEIEKLKKWAIDKYTEKKDTFAPKEVSDGQMILLADQPYTVKIIIGQYKTYRGKLENNTLHLYLPHKNSAKTTQELLYKTAGLAFVRWLNKRVPEINNQTLKKPFSAIETKNMTSRWGSCSSRGVLTFSNQLFFQPKWVIDYVIVHELCHLVEMNHSDRFWKLVATYFPNYLDAKAYLKNGNAD